MFSEAYPIGRRGAQPRVAGLRPEPGRLRSVTFDERIRVKETVNGVVAGMRR
jgi:hypothetical protein